MGNTGSRWALVVGIGLIVGLLTLGGLTTVAFAQGPGSSWGHGGMMGGPGGMSWGTNRSGWNLGGMMGDWGRGLWNGMMGGFSGMGSGSCHGGWGNPGTGEPLTIDEAAERVEAYLDTLNNPDLILAEVMAFESNFYAEIEAESTGIHAFELLVHRYTGAVSPEPGPNMMWNTEYGHMAGGGGMMGGWWGATSGPMTVSAEQALANAQAWLDGTMPGTTVDEHADAFYGYYTIHTLYDGEIEGMLSVNGYTGDVWYHNWHGDFIGMQEFEHHGE